MRTPAYQYFSLDEYRARLAALRGAMEAADLDALIVTIPENLYYLTGYQTPGHAFFVCLIVLPDRDPVFIPRAGEDRNVINLSWVEDCRTYQDLDDPIAHARDVLVELGLERGRIGLEQVSLFLTIRTYVRLTELLHQATFLDGSGLVERGRMVKSEQEIAYLRQAAIGADAAMTAAIESASVGVMENDVAASAYRAQILAGSEYTAYPNFIITGPHAYSHGHGTWYRRRLEAGQLVFLETVGAFHRYHACLIRPLYLGRPSEHLLRSAGFAVEVLETAKDAIRPGVRAGQIYDLVQAMAACNELGFQITKRVGYSMGIAYAPDWGEGHIISMWKGDDRPLQAGMAFHLLPGGIFVEGVGVLSCTDTVLVTEDGCETLTSSLAQRLYVA